MFWTLFTRRNILILAGVILIGLLGAAYARIQYIKKDNELLTNSVETLKADVKEREIAIESLNTEVAKLLKEKEILSETLKSSEEKVKVAEQMFSDIKEEYNISVEEILEDPNNYVVSDDLNFSFDENGDACKPTVREIVVSSQPKKRQLNLSGQRKISEKTLDAMWQSYCHANKCETKK